MATFMWFWNDALLIAVEHGVKSLWLQLTRSKA